MSARTSAPAMLLFVLGAWLAMPVRAGEETPPTTLADQAVVLLGRSGYKLDYSVKSLVEIDRFFDEQSEGGAPRAGSPLSQDFDMRMFGLGAYLGEVLIRACGGSWMLAATSPSADSGGMTLKLSNGATVWPMGRIAGRLKLGAEDGIYAYGFVITRDCKH